MKTATSEMSDVFCMHVVASHVTALTCQRSPKLSASASSLLNIFIVLQSMPPKPCTLAKKLSSTFDKLPDFEDASPHTQKLYKKFSNHFKRLSSPTSRITSNIITGPDAEPAGEPNDDPLSGRSNTTDTELVCVEEPLHIG